MGLAKPSTKETVWANNQRLHQRTKTPHVSLLSLTLLAAAGAYIMHLRRELAAARSRGDMYRDIAASLDRQSQTRSTAAEQS